MDRIKNRKKNSEQIDKKLEETWSNKKKSRTMKNEN